MKAGEGTLAKRIAVVCPWCGRLLDKDSTSSHVFCGGCGYIFWPSQKDIDRGKDRKELLEAAFKKTS